MKTTGKRYLGFAATWRAMALAIGGLALILMPPSSAQTVIYSPSLSPTNGDDVVTGDTEGMTIINTLELLGGNDTLTITGDGGTIDVLVDGGLGDDIIRIEEITRDALVINLEQDVRGGEGNDTITLIGIDFDTGEGIFGDEGNDTILLENVFSGSLVKNAETGNPNGSPAGDIDGGAGNDIIILAGTTGHDGPLLGGTGNDTITVQTASTIGGSAPDISQVNQGIDGGDGDDIINVDAAVIFQKVGTTAISGGVGNDVVNIQNLGKTGTGFSGLNGDAGADILLGAGNDTLNISNSDLTPTNDFNFEGSDFDGQGGDDTFNFINVFSDDNILGGADNDTVSFTTGTINSVAGEAGMDTINLTDVIVTLDVSGGNDDDTISITMTNVTNVLGGNGNDVMTVTDSTVAADVNGQADNDTITVTNSNVDNILGDGGNDTITVDAGTVVKTNVEGNDGNDIIMVNSGASIDGNILGNGGDDTIVVDNADFDGDVTSGGGNDNITVRNQTAANAVNSVNAGAEDDVVAIEDSFIAGDVGLGDGNNTLTATGSNLGNNVNGGVDMDTVTIDSTTVDGNIALDAGFNTLTIRNNSTIMGVVTSGDDGSIVTVSNSTLQSDLTTGTGTDQVTISNSTLQSNLVTGDGDDTVFVEMSTVDGRIETTSGIDVITVVDSTLRDTMATGEVIDTGGNGDDTISLLRVIVEQGDVNARSGNNTISIVDSTFLDSGSDVRAAAGADNLKIFRSSIGGVVNMDGGEDLIEITRSDIGGQVTGGAGNDLIVLNSSSVGTQVVGADGIDTVTLGGVTVVPVADGGADADSLNINLLGVSASDIAELNALTPGAGANGTVTFDSGISLEVNNFETINVNAQSFAAVAPEGFGELGLALDAGSPFQNPAASADFSDVLRQIAESDPNQTFVSISPIQYLSWDLHNFVEANYMNRVIEHKVTMIRSGRAAGLGTSFTLYDGSMDRYLRETHVKLAQAGPTLRSDVFRPSYLSRTSQETRVSEAEVLKRAGGRQDYAFWAEGSAIHGESDEYGAIPGLTMSDAKFLLGGDWRIGDTFALGAFTGYTNSDIDFDGNVGNTGIEAAKAGMYFTYYESGAFVNTSFTYSHKWYEGRRNIMLPDETREVTYETEGNTYNVYANAGYDFRVDGFRITPSLGIQYVLAEYDEFSESGADSLSLNVNERHDDSLQSIVGVRASYRADIGIGYLHPEISAYWLHEFLDDEPNITASFSEPGTPEFTVYSDSYDTDTALIGAGLNAELVAGEEWANLFFKYNSQIGGNVTAHGINSGVRVDF